MASKVFTHGYSGYTNHRCRCEVCREGNRVKRAESRAHWKSERERIHAMGFEHVVINITHGVNGYSNYMCRCLVCIVAHREARPKKP